jgi:aspartyl-tRNA(Asn)/glutamyl-tRNA(Gln) amidotransferase subunit B
MGDLIDMVGGGMVTGKAMVSDVYLWSSSSDGSSGSSGKILLRHMLNHPSSEAPSELAGGLGLLANRGDDFLERLCTQVIAEMPEEADAMRRGVPNVINKLLGRVMKSSKGTADPKSIRKMLQKLLSPS